MSKSERNYCVTRQELLAIVWFTEHFKQYLLGQKFLLRTDHGSLRWLFSFKEPEGQMARWLERLSRFNPDIQHRPGIKHGNSDGLSRIPCEGKCRNCMKGHELEAELSTQRVRAQRTNGLRRQRGRTARVRKQRDPDPLPSTEWMKEIKEWQTDDRDLQIVSSWTERPRWAEIAQESTTVKYWWARWVQLERSEGVWYYKWKTPSGDIQHKVVVPAPRRGQVLFEHHWARMAAHFGVERTLQRLKQSPYFWPKMRESVERYCKDCQLCARTRVTNRRGRAPMHTLGAGATMERVGIDIMGPLPESDKGNKYIIVIGDYWTKWTEAYAVPNHTASTVASIVVECFFSRFGIPQQIHTDQGREFEGLLFQAVCQLLGIDKTRTTPWRPCSNGMIERFNRTLGVLLRQTTSKHQRDWDQYLDLLTMAYRSTVHESTGQTPNRMMLGRELPMPTHLLVATPEAQPADYQNYAGKLQDQLLEIHEMARECLKGSHQKQKKQYDRTATMSVWEMGTSVWLFNPPKTVGKCPKLCIIWEETPYVIIERISDVVVRIRKGPTAKPRVVHVDRLKPVEGPVDISWFNGQAPEEVVPTPPARPPTPQEPVQRPRTALEEMGLRVAEYFTRSGRLSKPPTHHL